MKSEKSLRVLLWLAAVGVFMQTLDATIVNTALPAMAASLGESPLRMQWVVIAYSLAMATLIPASGWIADRFGTRRTFLTAIVLFSIGSLLCAYSRTLWQLVGSHVIQGMGGAMLLPVGRLAVLRGIRYTTHRALWLSTRAAWQYHIRASSSRPSLSCRRTNQWGCAYCSCWRSAASARTDRSDRPR